LFLQNISQKLKKELEIASIPEEAPAVTEPVENGKNEEKGQPETLNEEAGFKTKTKSVQL
jgi:hypothetical protein